jgi:hypothetical protein
MPVAREIHIAAVQPSPAFFGVGLWHDARMVALASITVPLLADSIGGVA